MQSLGSADPDKFVKNQYKSLFITVFHRQRPQCGIGKTRSLFELASPLERREVRARPAAARRGHERGPNDDGGETQTAAGQRRGEREEE